MFNYYTAEEQYIEKYFQLPKVFFEDERYISLSNDSKIAYAILKDRFNYSIKNKWVDENDRIYFIYTNKELEKILNVSNKTVVKIKKELQSVHLLVQVKQGLNKANLLYLGKPSVNSENSYQKNKETLDNKGSVNSTLPKNSPQTLDNKGSVNSTLPKNSPQTLDNKGSVNSTHNLYINNNLDTLKDTLKDTINLDKFAQQIESEIDDSYTNSIPEQAKHTLLVFSQNNYKIVEEQIGMIYRAKKYVANKYNVLLLIEHDELGFINAVKSISLAIFKDKKDIHKIKNYDNYFYKSFEKYFEQCAEKIKFQEEIENENLPNIPM